MDRNRVITGLNDIGGFIAGRIGYEQARNFLRTIDEAIELLKEQQEQIDKLFEESASNAEMAEGLKELLKEQEAVAKQWTKEIADNQLAHAPKDSHEFMSLNEHLENEYKKGIWDGLQIAWNIISDGR